MYEMLTGLPPFYCPNRSELFDKIKFGNVKYPNNLSPTVRSLLEGLFIKDPERRFGFGIFIISDEVKNHLFFSNMNWEALYQKKIIPPFKP